MENSLLSTMGPVIGVLLPVSAAILSVLYRRVVPTNMVHIIQSSKKTIAYGKGKDAGNAYFEWPKAIPFIGISVTTFPESIFKISLEDYPAYDSARLPFVVDVTAFFRVEDANVVAQRVSSFTELEDQLHQVIQGAVRRILSINNLEEIMEARSSLAEIFTKEVNKDILEWGVISVKNIEFMDIRDTDKSQVIQNIMAKEQSRIDMESRIQVAQNKQQAKLAEIDAQRTVDVQEQDALQQVGIRKAEKDKLVGIATEKSTQEIKAEAKTTAERDMDVVRVTAVEQAKINKEAFIIKAEQDQRTAEIKADQERNVKKIDAEGGKASIILLAEGDLEKAKNDAEGIKLKGLANAEAERAILMAPVDTQIVLAKEIGENQGYQQYLLTVKQIEAGQVVGIEMAKAIQGADLKVISNAGDVQSGVSKIGDLFSTTGGTNLTGMLTALSQTSEGAALVDGLVNRLKGNDKAKS